MNTWHMQCVNNLFCYITYLHALHSINYYIGIRCVIICDRVPHSITRIVIGIINENKQIIGIY